MEGTPLHNLWTKRTKYGGYSSPQLDHTSSTQTMRAVVAATICPLEFLVTPPSIEEKLREKPNQGLEVSSVSQKSQSL